jgi:predicted nucleotidyltransferase
LGGMQYELQQILGIRVDVRTLGDLHPRMRNEVLREARAL